MEKPNFRLKELIEQVKDELLDYQTSNEGKPATLILDQVTLDVGVSINQEASGKLNFYVFELGGGEGNTASHNVKLSFSLPKPEESEPANVLANTRFRVDVPKLSVRTGEEKKKVRGVRGTRNVIVEPGNRFAPHSKPPLKGPKIGPYSPNYKGIDAADDPEV